MKTTLALTILICIFICFAQVALSAPPPPVQTPIDGGLSLIIGGGVAYAARKMYKNKQKEE